jgi:hypothetical protein
MNLFIMVEGTRDKNMHKELCNTCKAEMKPITLSVLDLDTDKIVYVLIKQADMIQIIQ